MIEVIERHEYYEPEYFMKCSRCQSILKFAESDAIFEEDNGYHDSICLLECPVCGYSNILGNKKKWKTEKGEL